MWHKLIASFMHFRLTMLRTRHFWPTQNVMHMSILIWRQQMEGRITWLIPFQQLVNEGITHCLTHVGMYMYVDCYAGRYVSIKHILQQVTRLPMMLLQNVRWQLNSPGFEDKMKSFFILSLVGQNWKQAVTDYFSLFNQQTRAVVSVFIPLYHHYDSIMI